MLLDPLRRLAPPQEVLDATALSGYIVETRYPGALPDSTEADSERAASQAAAVVAWAEQVTQQRA